MQLNSIETIEEAMADVAVTFPFFGAVHAEYERLLKIMGNVDGPEMVTLVLVCVAMCAQQVKRDKGELPWN